MKCFLAIGVLLAAAPLAGAQIATPADPQQANELGHPEIVAAAAPNKSAALKFLARNGQKKGVVTTPSGLQYKVLVPGNLAAPAVSANDELVVNYRGTLLDGSEFDSTYARGVPATFKLNEVIAGLQEGLALMKPGAKWQLFVPPKLGYGNSPRPGIEPGSLLLFEVDLVSVIVGTLPPWPRHPAPSAAPPAAPPTTQ